MPSCTLYIQFYAFRDEGYYLQAKFEDALFSNCILYYIFPSVSSACAYTSSSYIQHMDEGTLEIPIPQCRLYWSFLFGVVKQFCRF
jgi:hypothetical protein